MKLQTLILFCYVIGALIGCDIKKETKETDLDRVEDKPLQFPFNNTTSIVVLSYENRTNWKDLKPEEILVRDSSGVLQLAGIDLTDRIKESVLVKGNRIEELHEILYETDCTGLEDISLCYDPRHLFLFKNASDSVIAGLEICLDCTNGIASEGMRVPAFCERKFLKIEEFLKSVGIKYYTEF